MFHPGSGFGQPVACFLESSLELHEAFVSSLPVQHLAGRAGLGTGKGLGQPNQPGRKILENLGKLDDLLSHAAFAQANSRKI